MGRVLDTLSEKKISEKSIFNNRFCIEICERVHTHYRNLRIVQSLDDFIVMAEGFSQAIERWKKRGCPGTGEGVHIELCRKAMAVADQEDKIKISLNDNLYNKNQDKIFSMGADFTDENYVHLKYRDLRLEMSIPEFEEFASVINEAHQRVKSGSSDSVLSEATIHRQVS